ncbi:MAG: helix-turn-helix domain-containing protein [Actinocatenispora sp.]
MSLESSGRTRPRLFDDPLAIRALAHPTRLALYLLVGRDGPITAAEAARQVDISQALASHHLRQLAKYGFVEPAEPGDSRERPWQTTSTSFSTGSVQENPELAGATSVLHELVAERALANLVDWHARRADWEPRWQDVTGAGSSTLYLTYDELRELNEKLGDLIRPLALRRPVGEPAARPADAVPVSLCQIITPLPPTSSGG